MKAQASLEYTFAVLMWVIVCIIISFVISPYVEGISSQSSIRSSSSMLQHITDIASSDLDGLKYLHGHYTLNSTISFNNTIAAIATDDGIVIAQSPFTYSYADDISLGDRMLVKNQDGEVRVVRVS